MSIFGYGIPYSEENKVHTVKPIEISVDELPEYLKNKTFVAWSPVLYNGRRSKRNAVRPRDKSYIVLDFDYWEGKLTEENILTIARDLRSMVVTTKSSNYHIIIPIDISEQDYFDILERAKSDLDFEVLDTRIYEPSRVFFVSPRRRVWDFTDGTYFTYDDIVCKIHEHFSRFGISRRARNKSGARSLSTIHSDSGGAVVDYIKYCVRLIARRNPKYNYFIGSSYISFDPDPDYDTTLSCYTYYRYPSILLNTDKSLIRLYGENYQSEIEVEYNGNVYIVRNPKKFIRDIARSWGVEVPDYNRFLDLRWVVKFNFIYLLYEYMKSKKEFAFRPEYGFNSSKFGTRSDRRLRRLKQMLMESKLLIPSGNSRGSVRFARFDLFTFYKVVKKFLLEELRLPVFFVFTYLHNLYQPIEKYLENMKGLVSIRYILESSMKLSDYVLKLSVRDLLSFYGFRISQFCGGSL